MPAIGLLFRCQRWLHRVLADMNCALPSRLFMKDQPIAILDEATSAHDGNSESIIQEAVSLCIRNRTFILTLTEDQQ